MKKSSIIIMVILCFAIVLGGCKNTDASEETPTEAVTPTKAETKYQVTPSVEAYDYKITDKGTVTLLGFKDFRIDYQEVIMPDTIEGLPVTKIDKQSFWGYKFIVVLVIPDSIEEIGTVAFRQCASLESVTIGDGVKTIGSAAFRDCPSLKKLIIGKNVKYIATYAFSQCPSLEEVVLPEGLESIGDQAFCDCNSLTSIYIPESVTYITNDFPFGSHSKIYCKKGSYAESYLKNSSYHYEYY